ncbi:hypothetical protein GCM10011588_08130 [Nocardia jinanensis]|uniref:Uncharacterized protein n=1 Tax=Nocardia jinanensis TaxID=382504 RepID=A0A917VMH1_9NOCA|nr:hypothetical protein GCM10011588_08130 [Nocardia jinanensis]
MRAAFVQFDQRVGEAQQHTLLNPPPLEGAQQLWRSRQASQSGCAHPHPSNSPGTITLCTNMIGSRFGNPGHRIVVHNKASWIMLLHMQEHKTPVRNVANSVLRKPNDPSHGTGPGPTENTYPP